MMLSSPKRLRNSKALASKLEVYKTAIKLGVRLIQLCRILAEMYRCKWTVRECRVWMFMGLTEVRWKIQTWSIMHWLRVRIYHLPDKRKLKVSLTLIYNSSDPQVKLSMHMRRDLNHTTIFQIIYQTTNQFRKLIFIRYCLVMTKCIEKLNWVTHYMNTEFILTWLTRKKWESCSLLR